MTKIAIAGAGGRMGQCLTDIANRDARFVIAASLVEPSDPKVGSATRDMHGDGTFTETLSVPADVLIDFTIASGTDHWLDVCTTNQIPMIIGATGHDDEQLDRITKASKQIPIVLAPNCSTGVNVLLSLVGQLAKSLGHEYDIEIVDTHHRHKKDAPSGTAIAITNELIRATGRSASDVVQGRAGNTGEKDMREIGVHSVRLGEIVGEHEVHFSGPGETLTIHHKAHSRETFAAGALRAAAWIVGKPAGLYSMRDVVGA